MDISFAAERTLGRLSKWLRVLGFDTIFEQNMTPGDFVTAVQNRVLLTRKRNNPLVKTSLQSIFIRSDHYIDQVKEVITALEISLESVKLFYRCIRCNTVIMDINKKEARGKVPDYIWEMHEKFRKCHQCNRIYWAGTHVENSLEKVRGLFNHP